MPPPHSPPHSGLSRAFTRLSKLFLCAAALALAGCATQTKQTADASSSHLLRDAYLIQTQADPLGAWLSTDGDLAINRADSLNYGSSSSPKTIVSTAMKFLGVKYRYGGDTPGEGFDCSGLVAYAAEKSLGLKLPRSAREMAREGISVDRDELRRGDLVFFNTRGHRYSHVGIYLGDHKFVHAPRSGAKVRVESMDIAYWRKRYNGARRIGSEIRTAAAETSKPTQRAAAQKPQRKIVKKAAR
ncbi:C40 family peptidase [Castellaniella sp. GW247-6E4]|uniref:C40 family peptidase n=1 Tax=Castellaniella sp. GW247-6E4 TaxID=3140380 RepID=UPI003314BED7